MKLLIADYLYTQEGFIFKGAVAFDEHIKEVGSAEVLLTRYPNAERIELEAHSVLYPGFINTHVHLEFCANATTLRYGEFITWLHSVIAHREAIFEACDDGLLESALAQMLQSGITTIGAISSRGYELDACAKAKQRVIFFNELIGSQAAMADALYNDFLERLELSKRAASKDRFVPAVAIHAPYSVHPILLQKAISLAKTESLPLTTHFLESPAEREWLESASGAFAPFFKEYFKASAPITGIEEFMHAFDATPTLFVHGVQAKKEELEHLAAHGHTLAHCPRSNRYLGCGRLEIESLPLPFCLATDGLSSNDSLSILDEMRAALMMHHHLDIHELSHRLIKSVTADAAKALKLNIGKIEPGFLADFVAFKLPNSAEELDDVALWTTLHAKKASRVWIGGEEVFAVAP